MQEVKRGFRFYVRIYGMIFAQDLKSKMSYRADFIISTFGMLFSNISGFYFRTFLPLWDGITMKCCFSTVFRCWR